MKPSHKTEWRTCGLHSSLGPWAGPWKDYEPKDNDLRDLVKRNQTVRVERREVWQTPARIVRIFDRQEEQVV